MSSELIQVDVGDGHRLVVEVFEAPGADAVVVMLPAMGITSGWYSQVATALVHAGLAVAVADWRGHGTSNVRAARSVNWGYRQLAEVDVPATLNAVKQRFPGLPVYALGHSLGGQVASLHAAAFPGEFAGVALIASVTLHYKDWGFPRSWGVLAFTQIVRAIALALGYFPGNRLRFAGREGRQQMIDWANNGLTGRWVLGGSANEYERLLAEIDIPVLMMSIEGDPYTPDRALATHLSKMPRAAVTRHQWTDSDLEPGGLHHLKWVRHSGPIVDKLRDWIESTRPQGEMILHIASDRDWAARRETYAPTGWESEGFVHCSDETQLVRTANRVFSGRRDLVLLEIDPARISAEVIWEDTSGSGENFPHIYGPIEADAVVSAVPFHAEADGSFDWWTPPA